MGVMINSVRNTVLAIANKNNYGYVSPQDFNLYAQQAQMDLFEDYFYQYNNWLTKENQRVSGTGYADIVKSLVEVIDSFSVTKSLKQQASNFYNLPDDYYFINKVNYYPNYISGAVTTGLATNKLIDAAATFVTTGTVKAGQYVVNTSAGNYGGISAYVVSVDSNTQLTLSANPFGVAATVGNSYAIFNTSGIVEVERVNQNKIFYLNNSPLTAPSVGYPAYVLGGATTKITGDASSGQLGNTITVYPTTIIQNGSVSAEYVRYPSPPKWTYLNVGGTTGSPEFDSSQADYQDFELPLSDEPGIVAKICQYIGIEIREADVYQFGKQEELLDNQTQG
jgi:hypothetical protein|tara:strand:+ start:2143 stop:3153 length:1011 start_codon:yes stop_codon:yes gene_type:complete